MSRRFTPPLRLAFFSALISLLPGALALSAAATPQPIDVYLIGGQSNATGQGYLKNLPPSIAPDSRGLLFHSGPPHLHAPDLVFVYGCVLPPPNAQPGRDAVRAGERDVAQDSGSPLAVRGAFVVPTDDLDHRATDPDTRYPTDHLHFGTAGTLKPGRRLAEKNVRRPRPAQLLMTT